MLLNSWHIPRSNFALVFSQKLPRHGTGTQDIHVRQNVFNQPLLGALSHADVHVLYPLYLSEISPSVLSFMK